MQREAEGRKYVEFEFASKAPNYIRHALASVTIANGALTDFAFLLVDSAFRQQL